MEGFENFVAATLLERATVLLVTAFGSSAESVSRINTANHVANIALGDRGPIVMAGQMPGGRVSRDAVFRAVSEAWQVLELAGLVCRDLMQSQGDWWLLTAAGERVRNAADVGEAIREASPVPD